MLTGVSGRTRLTLLLKSVVSPTSSHSTAARRPGHLLANLARAPTRRATWWPQVATAYTIIYQTTHTTILAITIQISQFTIVNTCQIFNNKILKFMKTIILNKS